MMNPDGVYLGNYRGSLIGDQTVVFSNTSISASLLVLHIHPYALYVLDYSAINIFLLVFITSLCLYDCTLSLTHSYVCILSSIHPFYLFLSSLHPYYLYPFFTISLLFYSFLHYIANICTFFPASLLLVSFLRYIGNICMVLH